MLLLACLYKKRRHSNLLIPQKKIISTLVIASTIVLIAPSVKAQSSITETTPGTPVNPAIVDTVLAIDDPLSFSVDVTVEANPSSLDLFFVQDLSSSFSDDIAVVRTLIPDLVSNIGSRVSDVRYGYSSFVDKPINPFGRPSRGDYVYRTDLALTSDTSTLQDTVNGLQILSGGDIPESQLEALLQVGVRAQTPEIGFRSDALNVAVVATDAPFHRAGDGARAGITTPNNLDAVLDIGPDGLEGTGEDYPTVADVREVLRSARINPIFAVTSNQIRTYQALVNDLGFGTVVELESDSSNLVDAVLEGISDISRNIQLFADNDDYSYVSSIRPADGFTDVPPGATRSFDVTLLADSDILPDGNVLPDTINLISPGFGETIVNVEPLPPAPEPEAEPPAPEPEPEPLPPIPDPDPPIFPQPEDPDEVIPEPTSILGSLLLGAGFIWRKSKQS